MMYGLALTAAGLFGALLSLVYFGGLWLTVRRARQVRRMKRLLIGSFVVRTVLVLGGFYLVLRLMGERWELLALALLGFLTGRSLLIRRWRPDIDTASPERDTPPHGH